MKIEHIKFNDTIVTKKIRQAIAEKNHTLATESKRNLNEDRAHFEYLISAVSVDNIQP